MIISTTAGASQIVSARDDTRFYDDIACLARDWPAHGDSATAFVQIAGGRWIEAQRASFVRQAVRTPMGSGLVAYASEGEARASDRTGEPLTWNDVLDVARSKP